MDALASLDRRPLRWPLPGWFGPVMIAYIAWTWWQVSKAQLDQGVASAVALTPETGATLVLLARVVGWLLESGYYVLWWRWRQRTLPFWRYFQWTAAISIVDLLAEALRRDGPEGAVTWRAWWVGAGSARGPTELAGSWEVAFGQVGLLVLVRLAMTIRTQREALAPIGWEPALFVTSTWLAGRLVAAWTYDLMRGSPLH